MALSFVFINVSSAHKHQVYNKLSKLPYIVEMQPLCGEYDIFAKIYAEDFEKIGNIVVDEIRTIDGIIDTKTLTGAKFQ